MATKRHKPLVMRPKSFTDARGVLTPLATGDRPFDFMEVATFASKGATRGNHYHTLFHEYVFVESGYLDAILVSTQGSEPVTLGVGPGELIYIEPMIHHILTAREPTVAISYGYGGSPFEDRHHLGDNT